MKVTLNKQGGFAGGISWQPHTVESSQLPQAAVDELETLVSAAKAAAPVSDSSSQLARDSMTFQITIDEANGESTTLEQSDTAMSPSFAALLEWLERATGDE